MLVPTRQVALTWWVCKAAKAVKVVTVAKEVSGSGMISRVAEDMKVGVVVKVRVVKDIGVVEKVGVAEMVEVAEIVMAGVARRKTSF